MQVHHARQPSSFSSPSSSRLCDACAALRLGHLRSEAGYRLHANAKDVVASARAGCDLCALIRAALLQDLSPANEGEGDDDVDARLRDVLPPEPVTLYGGFVLQDEGEEEEEEEDEDGGASDGWASSSSSSRLTGIEVHVGQDDNLNIVSLNLFTIPESGQQADEADDDDDVSGRPLLDDAGSEEALALLRTWLGTCLSEHPQCRGTFAGLEAPPEDDVAPLLPTRVIDVGAAADASAVPRLLVSNGARAEYAALSHCWGKERFQTTTTSNLAAHCAALPAAALTKTFRDAVAVTRALGLRYLWIDSLCIVQDSSDDWRTESAQMGHVYQRAELTIAATGASDGRGGCFLPRPTRRRPVRLAQLREGAAVAARPVYAGLYPDQAACSLSKSPLGDRAWITQEWLFSRRTVHYTQARMVWSCKARLESEDGEGVARMDEQRLHHSLERYRRWKADTRPARDPREPVGFYSDWCDLITTYTSRSLTYETDKPVAILSLALDVQQRLGERWQHGLFHGPYPVPDQLVTGDDDDDDDSTQDDATLRYLALQLLWFGKRVLDRPATLAHQPSWSWLSTMGPVNVHAPARVADPVVSRLGISEATATTDDSGAGRARPALAVTGPLQPATALDRAIRAAHPPEGGAASPALLAHRRADEGARFFSRSSFLRTGAAIMPLGTCHFFGADPAGPDGAMRVRTGWGSFDDGALPPLGRLFVAALSQNVLDDGRFDGYNVLYLAERPGGTFVRVGMGEILHEEAFPPACRRSYCVF